MVVYVSNLPSRWGSTLARDCTSLVAVELSTPRLSLYVRPSNSLMDGEMLPITLLIVVTSLSSLKVSKGLLNSWYAAILPCASYAEYVGLLLRASPITPPMLGRCCLVLFALRFTSTISLSFRNFWVALNLPEYLFRSLVLMIPSWFCKPKEAK